MGVPASAGMLATHAAAWTRCLACMGRCCDAWALMVGRSRMLPTCNIPATTCPLLSAYCLLQTRPRCVHHVSFPSDGLVVRQLEVAGASGVGELW